jgi:hypothetical protein
MLDSTFRFFDIAEINATIWALEWAYDNDTDILQHALPEDMPVHEALIAHKRLTNLRAVLVRMTGNPRIPEPKLPKHAQASHE